MSVLTKAGSFLSGTGAAATTVAITGVGFSPDAIIFFTGGGSALDAIARGVHRRSIGFACRRGGVVDNAAVFSFDQDTGATSDVGSGNSTTLCAERLTTGGVDGGSFKVTSLDADGFTVTINTQYGSSTRYGYLCIGGTDIQAVGIGNFTLPLTATTKAITGVGGRPDVVFLSAVGRTGTGTINDENLMFGCAVRNGLNQGVLACGSDHGVATAQTKSYARVGECFGLYNTAVTALDTQGSVSSFDADGFTINMSAVKGSAVQVQYLAITGGIWNLGNTTTPTDTVTTKVRNDFGKRSKGFLFVGSEGAADASGVPHDDSAATIGAVDSALNQYVAVSEAFDGGVPSVVNGRYDNAFYADGAYTPALEVKTGIVANGLNAFSFINSDNTIAQAAFMWYAMVADANPSVFTNHWI